MLDCLLNVDYEASRLLGVKGFRSGDVPVLWAVEEGSLEAPTVRVGEVQAISSIGDGGTRRIKRS